MKKYKEADFDREVYGVEEVARLLGVTRQTVSNYIKKGKIKYYETNGGHARFKRDDIIEYMDSRGMMAEETKIKTNCDEPIIYVRTENKEITDSNVEEQIECIKKTIGEEKFDTIRMIIDVGKANEGNRYGLKEIKQLAESKKINRIFLYRKEELAGDFTEYVESFLNSNGVELIGCKEK